MKLTPFNPNRGQFIGGGVAAAAATFASINVIAAPMKEVVVGLDVPLTGPYSDQGQDQLRAYKMAISEINAHGGVMGMQVKYTTGDDQTKPGPAVENATRMIERDGAIMITGGSSTGTAVAVSGKCQEKKTIFMATLTHGDETTNESCHYHTFRRYNNAHMSARAMAKTLLTKYGTGRWFHITADYTWGHSVYDNLVAVVEPHGAKTIKNVLLPLGTADFSSALSQAQAAKPDVLVITEFGKDMVNCLNQAAQFGLTKTAKILVPLADEYMAKGTGDNFDGVVTTAPFYWKYYQDKNPNAKKFIADLERRGERIHEHLSMEGRHRARRIDRSEKIHRKDGRLPLHRDQGAERILARHGPPGHQQLPGHGRRSDGSARERLSGVRVCEGARGPLGRVRRDHADRDQVQDRNRLAHK